MTRTLNKYYAEGWRAFQNGIRKSDNPYVHSASAVAAQWDAGWDAIDTFRRDRVNPPTIMAKARRLFAALGADQRLTDQTLAAEEIEPGMEAASGDGSSKPCPFCAEVIKLSAIKCRYCGSDLIGAKAALPVPNAAQQKVMRDAVDWAWLYAMHQIKEGGYESDLNHMSARSQSAVLQYLMGGIEHFREDLGEEYDIDETVTDLLVHASSLVLSGLQEEVDRGDLHRVKQEVSRFRSNEYSFLVTCGEWAVMDALRAKSEGVSLDDWLKSYDGAFLPALGLTMDDYKPRTPVTDSPEEPANKDSEEPRTKP